MRQKWRNIIINVEAYITFSNIGSDHRIIASKVRLSLRANRKTLPRKLRYNWHLFKSDISLLEKYAVDIKTDLSCKAMKTFQIHMNDS